MDAPLGKVTIVTPTLLASKVLSFFTPPLVMIWANMEPQSWDAAILGATACYKLYDGGELIVSNFIDSPDGKEKTLIHFPSEWKPMVMQMLHRALSGSQDFWDLRNRYR